MTAASIKRGGAVRKPRAMIKGKAKPKPSVLARTIESIPISAAAMQRVVTFSILGVAGAAMIAIAMMLGLPAYAATQLAEVVGGAGFAVKRVEVTGIDRMDRLTVYAVALDQKSRAMPLVDLDKVRGELLQYGWIADARVSRRLPDTLVVDIVERKAAAVWQHEQQLSLIDDKGVVLEPVALNAMPDLPLLIGPDANVQATALSDLMSHAPRLKPMLAGATWVGNRRWDLRFQSGEVLALPEGDAMSAKALTKFSAMDGLDRLLGRGFLRFDMRDPAKMFVRVNRDKPRIDKPAGASDDGNDQHNEGGIA
ncbi:MAG: FtsQ-type protein [Sphingomonadales bacterium]|nr:FtsQ-type protein [Sphingomonadales bacterium]